MSIRVRNLILTAMAFGLAAYAARLGQHDLALACLTFVGGLWLHSGRTPPADPVPMSVAILCCLAFGCDATPGKFTLLSLGSYERAAAPAYGTQALLLADGLEMKPAAAPSCTAGRACIYTLNTDNLIYTKDANDLTLKLHAAQSYRTSANCAGLSSPAAGDVCYDTSIPAPRWYTGAGWSSFPTDSLVVHLAGTEVLTGQKTLAAIIFGGAVTASGANDFDLSAGTGAFKTPTGAGTLSGTTTLAANKSLIGAAGTGAVTLGSMTGAMTLPTGSLSWAGANTKTASLVSTGGAITITADAASTWSTSTGILSISGKAGTNLKYDGTTVMSVGVASPTAVGLTSGTSLFGGANQLIGAVTDKLNAAYLAIASQAAGDTLYADSTTTFARLAIGTAGKVLNVNSGATAPQWSYAPIIVTGGAATAIAGGATAYLVSPGIAASSATLVRLAMPPVAFTVRNLHCVADTLPGGTDTITCAVKRQVGGSGALSATTVTTPACTDAILTANTCEDTTHSQANVAGTALVIECVQSATSIAAGVTCSFLVTP